MTRTASSGTSRLGRGFSARLAGGLFSVGAAVLIGVLSAPFNTFAADDPITTAIQAEIDRTMAKLQLPDSPKPYFISVSLDSDTTTYVGASLGSLVASSDRRSAHIMVEVRVGDYKLDDSNFLGKQMWGGSSRLDMLPSTPIDGNPEVLRRALWWSLDQAYKGAVESFKRKKAVLENKSTPPVADDYARTPKMSYSAEETPQQLPQIDELQKQARQLSSILTTNKTLRDGTVDITAGTGERWFLNSEGARIHQVVNFASLVATATAQADDGVMVGDAIEFTTRSFDKLPAPEQLKTQIADLGKRVEEMRAAPLLEDFAGPVLFEDMAAAELCSRILPEAFASRRQPIVEDEQMARWMQGNEKESLRRKIGRRVMATGFNVTDNPTLRDFNGKQLVGHLPVDLEGVKPETVALVKNGILKTLLTTRTPDKKLPVSNGHATAYDYGMSGSTVQAGITSLLIQYENGLDEKALYARLIQAIKDQEVECGLLVRRLPQRDLHLGGSGRSSGGPNDEKVIEEPLYALRVDPEGAGKLVRVVALKGMNLAAFKDVLAAGKTLYVCNSWGEGGMTSIVCPSILFEEAVAVKPERNVSKPPVLPSPLQSK